MRINRRVAAMAAGSAMLLGSAVVWTTPAMADDVAAAGPETTTIVETDVDGSEVSIVLIPATSSLIEPTETIIVESTSVGSTPVESAPVESTPVESAPVESAPAGSVVDGQASEVVDPAGSSVVIETLSPGTTIVGTDGVVIQLGPAVVGSLVPAEPEVQVGPAQGQGAGTTVVVPGDGDADPTTIALGPARWRSESAVGQQPAPRNAAAEPAVTAAPPVAPVASAEVVVLGTSSATSEVAPAAAPIAAVTIAAEPIAAVTSDVEPAAQVDDVAEVPVSQAADQNSAAPVSGIRGGEVAAAAAVIAILGGALLAVRRRVLPRHAS